MSCGCRTSSSNQCGCEPSCVTCASVCVVLTVSNSWNVPACGSNAILAVDGLTSVLVGGYVFNPDYGWFKITGFNSLNGQITVENECIDGNATPGTTVPADTEFIFAATPTSAAVSILDAWVTPACSGTEVVTVSAHPTVVIGTYLYNPTYGWYEVTAYDPNTNILTLKNNCSTGNATAGTAVPAGTVFIFTDPPYNTEFIYNGGTSAGAVNVQTLTFVSTATAYYAGMTVLFTAGLTNTAAAPTINVNGFGAVTLVNQDGTSLQPGNIIANYQYLITYDGTNFVMLAPTTIPVMATSLYGGTSAGAVNVQTLTFVSTHSAYVTGMEIRFKAGLTNTAASPTLNVNGWGALVLVDGTSTGVPIGTIRSGTEYTVKYDGSNLIVVSPSTTQLVTYTPTLTNNGAGAFASNVFTTAQWQFQFASRICNVDLLFSTDMTAIGGTASQVSATIPFTSSTTTTIPGYVNDIAGGAGNVTITAAGTTMVFKKDVAGTAYSANTGRIFGTQIRFKVT